MQVDLLRGTLDMLVLKALTGGALHGYGIARWLEAVTADALRVEEGSLYPALRRLMERGWVRAEWGVSENNRRARYYTLTRRGRTQLQREVAAWERFQVVVGEVLNVPES